MCGFGSKIHKTDAHFSMFVGFLSSKRKKVQMSDNNQSGRFYSLQEVSAQCGLAPYILRYWELHFPELTADDSKPKHMYNASDISLINRIKTLLYVEHLTIEQAKGRLKQEMAFPVDYSGKAKEAATVEAKAEPQQAAPVQEVTPEPQVEVAPVVVAPAPEVVELVQESAPESVKSEETAHTATESGALPMDEIHRAAAAELANLRGEVQSLQSQLAEERQKTASAQELLSAEVAKVLETSQALQAKTDELAQVNQALVATRAQLAQLNGELTAARGELASKQSELATALQYSATNESARAAAFERLEAENALLRGKVSNFVNQLKDLSAVLTKTK